MLQFEYKKISFDFSKHWRNIILKYPSQFYKESFRQSLSMDHD